MSVEQVPFGKLVRSMRNGLSPATDGPYPGIVLTLSAVTRGEFDSRHRKPAAFGQMPRADQMVRPGMFLVCRGNGNLRLVGAGGVVPQGVDQDLVFPDTIIGAELDDARVDAAYLRHAWATDSIRGQIESGARTTNGTHKVNQQVLEAIVVPLPPLPEQRRIAAILDEGDALRRKRREALGLLDDLLRATFLEMFGDPVTNPRGWPLVALGVASEFLQYGTSVKCAEERLPDSIPVLRIPNIVGGELDWSDLKYASLSPRECQSLQLATGDLLFVRSNGNPDYIARCAVVPAAPLPSVFASYIIRSRLRTDAGFEPLYVQAVVSAPSFRSKIEREARTTAGNYNISAEGLRALMIPRPGRAAQVQYAAIHEALRVERARHLGAVSCARKLFSSLLHRAFSGTLGSQHAS